MFSALAGQRSTRHAAVQETEAAVQPLGLPFDWCLPHAHRGQAKRASASEGHGLSVKAWTHMVSQAGLGRRAPASARGPPRARALGWTALRACSCTGSANGPAGGLGVGAKPGHGHGDSRPLAAEAAGAFCRRTRPVGWFSRYAASPAHPAQLCAQIPGEPVAGGGHAAGRPRQRTPPVGPLCGAPERRRGEPHSAADHPSASHALHQLPVPACLCLPG